MIINILLTFVMISVFSFFLLIFKKFFCPPVFLSFIWILPILFVTFTEIITGGTFVFNEYSLIFPAGVLLFGLGYFLISRKKVIHFKNICFQHRKMSFVFKIFIITEMILIIYFFYDALNYVSSHYLYNIWYSYKWAVSVGNYTDFFAIPYLRTGSIIICCFMFVNFLNRETNRDNIWFFLQIVITFSINIFGQGRGGLFSLIIPLAIIYIFMNRNSKKRNFVFAIITLAFLLFVFIIYANLKDPTNSGTNANSLLLTIENYLCGGCISFTQWAETFSDYEYGLYTFRFVNAVLQGIGFDVNVVSMVEPYVENINGNIGNVYTIYKWYSNDFGLLYALFIQLLLGLFYGYIVQKTFKGKSQFWFIIFAYSFYPLFMQFFNDQYFSNFSIWVQILFWAYLFSKTNLFYIKKEDCSLFRKKKTQI